MLYCPLLHTRASVAHKHHFLLASGYPGTHGCCFYLLLFLTHSARRSAQAGRRGRAQLHRPQGDVALAGAGQTARADPWLPGPLRACGEWGIPRPAADQRRHAGRRPGTTAPADRALSLPLLVNGGAGRALIAAREMLVVVLVREMGSVSKTKPFESNMPTK